MEGWRRSKDESFIALSRYKKKEKKERIIPLYSRSLNIDVGGRKCLQAVSCSRSEDVEKIPDF